MKNPIHLRRKKKKQPLQQDPNPSPNLFDYQVFNPKLTESREEQIDYFLFYGTFVIQILFLIVIAMNYMANRQLQTLVTEVETLEISLYENEAVFESSSKLARKIDRYKNEDARRVRMADKIRSINNSVPSGVNLTTSVFETVGGAKGTFTFESDTALLIALLLSQLSENENVSQVVLNSAALDASDKFKVHIEVYFR